MDTGVSLAVAASSFVCGSPIEAGGNVERTVKTASRVVRCICWSGDISVSEELVPVIMTQSVDYWVNPECATRRLRFE